MTIINDRLAWLDGAAQRLAERLAVEGDCLVYTGTRSGGYGSIRVGNRMVKAHRLAWELALGPIPDGLVVCHRCDNPPCCRIEHLFLGTVADNNRDRASKGRSKGTFRSGPDHPATLRRGSNHWQAKLTDEDVRAIRTRHAAGEPQASIAADLHIHPATVSRIARRVWRQEVK